MIYLLLAALTVYGLVLGFDAFLASLEE